MLCFIYTVVSDERGILKIRFLFLKNEALLNLITKTNILNFLLVQTILAYLYYAMLYQHSCFSEKGSILPFINKILVSEERSIIAFNYTKNSAYSPAHRFPMFNSMNDPLPASFLHYN